MKTYSWLIISVLKLDNGLSFEYIEINMRNWSTQGFIANHTAAMTN